ncbi:E3 ubiquitin-protein ligase TRIM39-like [Clarias gariepinus]|uniref:E3 ubiquitin-protein ligase TRIM39-like n=1 Tax=Clarias gariepinus TaxID=13013 RepID=UPI00234DB3DD|nr:E3 ubiquitin-protein ligase TRIM39-like [Clarias gariepinus]
MASFRSVLREDQLQCSICLDVFTDPVSTPCGHNFCMICLNECWDSSLHCRCPMCKEEFPTRPTLRVNTFIAGLAAPFKKSVQEKSSNAANQLCSKTKNVFFDTYTHCKPHKTTTKLVRQKLMEPVENLENYICQKHEGPLELFCRDDQTYVCQVCTKGDHKTHNAVSIKEEILDTKAELGMINAVVQQMIQERVRKIEEIRQSTELYKKTTEMEKLDSMEIFSALMHCLERSQVELPKKMEEKQKAAERQAEGFFKDLEQEITELKMRNTELEQLSHTEDHLHLLQIYPSLCSPPHTKDWTDVTITPHLSVEALRREIIQDVLNNGINKFVFLELKKIQEHAVDVTLDPDTAHPHLALTNDGKEVTCENSKKNLPDNPERFDRCVSVLGKEGFSSGRFYYEVYANEKTEWNIGVVRESVNRKGQITACPENGFWCVSLDNQAGCVALDSPAIPLSLKQAAQKVGVFVDYEEGLISFYDVDAKSHIYSFTGQTFTGKLYPFFSPGLAKNSAPLIIYPWASHFMQTKF